MKRDEKLVLAVLLLRRRESGGESVKLADALPIMSLLPRDEPDCLGSHTTVRRRPSTRVSALRTGGACRSQGRGLPLQKLAPTRSMCSETVFNHLSLYELVSLIKRSNRNKLSLSYTSTYVRLNGEISSRKRLIRSS